MARKRSTDMTLIHRFIQAGFAVAALASASVPALAWTVWPDVDFEWYANVGKAPVNATVEVFPAARPGYIWSPGHYERVGSQKAWVAGHWVKDDYADQVALYANGPNDVASSGPMTLHDRQGSAIPTSPDAYPIDSSRR
jgi:hypothetical protein